VTLQQTCSCLCTFPRLPWKPVGADGGVRINCSNYGCMPTGVIHHGGYVDMGSAMYHTTRVPVRSDEPRRSEAHCIPAQALNLGQP
jgi:hypothetical protein